MRSLLLALVVLSGSACAQTSSRVADDLSPALTAPKGMTFLGGVEWSSAREDFGGFSGLALDGPNRIIALTDKVHWFRAVLREDPEGRLTGISYGGVGRLYADADTYIDVPFADSEALVRGPDGAWYVSFERKHRISRFGSLRGPEQRLPPPPGFDALPLNGGIEALAVLPDGRFVALAEKAPGRKPFPGWVIGPKKTTRFTLRRTGWFNPTDLALSPDGTELYLLERRFTLLGGFGMRLSRFPVSALAAGKPIKSQTMLVATSVDGVDNMEGLAVGSDAQGRTVLYIISDDNFRRLQRTLLLKYRLPAK